MSFRFPLFLSPVSHWRAMPAAAATAMLLSACGGGGDGGGATAVAVVVAVAGAVAGAGAGSGSGSSTSAGTPVVAQPTVQAQAVVANFPSDLAVAAPADLSDDTRLAGVLASGSTATLTQFADFSALFLAGGHAGCHGPAMLYAQHQDGGGTAAGLLPAGELGLWQATDVTTGQPCMVAEWGARTAGVRQQTRQALLLMAVLRATAAQASVEPAAGGRADLTSVLRTVLGAVPAYSGVTVRAASIARDAAGQTSTYRLVLNQGAGSQTRSGEIVLTHTAGADATAYQGTLRLAGFDLSGTTTDGCDDHMVASSFQVARITTVRYQRSGALVDFGVRSGQYCGAPASLDDADQAGQVASFTVDGELDPAIRLSIPAADSPPGSLVRADGVKGWRADFDRFGGHYDLTSSAGQFLHLWQTRPDDTQARALAAMSSYESSTDTRTVQGYHVYTDDIALNGGQFLGMVCNWSGPGHTRQPMPLFQSQTATKTGAASVFVASASKLTYAPTNNCTSTTTLFDANADGLLAAGEGQGVQQGLDAPTMAGRSVQDELAARGLVRPTMF